MRSGSRRRGSAGLVLVLGAGAFLLLPDVAHDGSPTAQAAPAASMTRAVVTRATTVIEDGLFKTTFDLRSARCASAPCPTLGVGVAWGGVMGDVRQVVGEHFAPRAGAEVQAAFGERAAPSPLGSPLMNVGPGSAPAVVRFVRPAR